MSHLKKQELEAVREALQSRLATLIEQIREGLDESQQHHFRAILGQSSGDSSDEALAASLVDLSAARIHHEVLLLRDLEAAGQRLANEDFGLCEDCGARIPLARLLASPAASRCVPCQSVHEKTHAGQERGSL